MAKSPLLCAKSTIKLRIDLQSEGCLVISKGNLLWDKHNLDRKFKCEIQV